MVLNGLVLRRTFLFFVMQSGRGLTVLREVYTTCFSKAVLMGIQSAKTPYTEETGRLTFA